MDVSDLPVVGRLVASGGILLDLLLHGGELVSLVVTIIVDGLLGQPELLVSMLLTLYRLGDRVPYIPASAVDTALTAALVMLLVVYIGRWLGAFGDSKT